MKLKKQMLISNIVVLTLPIVVAAIIGGIAIFFMRDMYWDPIEDMFTDRNGIVYAQSLIYAEIDDLTDSSPEHADIRKSASKRLVAEMAGLGYHIRYMLNGKEKFSNITPDDEMKAADLLGGEAAHLDHITASQDNVHVIKKRWTQSGNIVSIVAVNPGNIVKPNAFSFFYTYVGFFVFLILFFVLLSLVGCTMFFYKVAKQKVLMPLEQISKATKAIRSGDLSTPATVVSGSDEVVQLGKDFSDLQVYLRESLAQRVEYEQRRRELLSGISHDLRTPLTSIKGYTEGLLAGIANTPDKQLRYYKAIQTRTDDLERLVNNLSLYNHFVDPMFMFKPEICSFKKMVSTYVSEEKARFEQEAVTIEWNINTDEDTVYIDTAEFRRIFDNLFNNAIKYRVKATSRIRLSLEREGQLLVFLFSDDGPGVREDRAENIFEAFVRLDTARSHTDQGSGLGLAIVKKIIEAHKGTVRAYNDHGLTICMTLPLYQKKNGT